MKEWMGKLLELLNECRAEHDVYPVVYDEKDLDSLWILKRFVKWLVENDKIDLDKLEKKVLKENLIRKFDEWLLMLLAIQDEPIRFLCEILK